MDKFWENYIKTRPADSKGAFDAFKKMNQEPRIKVAELDNFNTPDLEQSPDSFLKPGETLEDWDVTFRRPNAQGGRIGFSEGTKPIITKEKFIELRITHKNKTNTEFAEILNEDWKPSQADSFNQNNVHKRMKDYKKDFPKDFDYKGSNIEKAVTEKKMIEFYGEEKYNKLKNDPKISDKKMKDRYAADKNYREMTAEQKQEKSKKSVLRKKKKIQAMDPDAREAFIAKEAEKAAARTRKKRGQVVKFNKNPRNFKSILWGNLVDRTYQNYYKDESRKLKLKPVGLETPPFKLDEKSLKLIKSKPELTRVDMEKIVLIDRNNKPITWDTIESYVNKGNALNSRGQPLSWDEITKPYKIKEFINKEGLAQTINKALIPNYDPVKDVKRSGWHIAHNSSFNRSPWETHIASGTSNIKEGAARKKFLNLWDGSDLDFKAGKIDKQKRFELRKKAVTDYKNTMKPITDIKYSLSKKERGAATPLEDLFKKAGIKLSGEQIQKAKTFLRNALNKGQNVNKFIPFKALRKPGMAAVAVLDYSLFHHLFGVPQTEALIAAGGWLTNKDIIGKQIFNTASMAGIMEEDQPTNLSELVGLPGPYKEDDQVGTERLTEMAEVMKVPERKASGGPVELDFSLPESFAGGGMAGIRRPSAIPPESGPQSQGLASLKKYGSYY